MQSYNLEIHFNTNIPVEESLVRQDREEAYLWLRTQNYSKFKFLLLYNINNDSWILYPIFNSLFMMIEPFLSCIFRRSLLTISPLSLPVPLRSSDSTASHLLTSLFFGSFTSLLDKPSFLAVPDTFYIYSTHPVSQALNKHQLSSFLRLIAAGHFLTLKV